MMNAQTKIARSVEKSPKTARSVEKSPPKRLQVELSAERLAALDALIDEGDLKTRKDVFDYAMSILHWAAGEARLGRDIASVDHDKGEVNVLRVPMLDNIKLLAKSREEAVEVGADSGEKSPAKGDPLVT